MQHAEIRKEQSRITNLLNNKRLKDALDSQIGRAHV